MKSLELPSAEKTIIYLIVIYVVGIVGMLVDSTRPLFMALVPFNILLAFAVLIAYHPIWNKGLLISCVIIYLGGFGVEWLGVKTGMIFGEYEYGSGLGFKFDGVPPIMGINWLILVYGSATIASRIAHKTWLKSLIGASLMVLYDIVLEPAAIRYHFWIWTQEQVPIQNYIAWLISAFVFIYLFLQVSKLTLKNPVAEAIFWLQLIFFGCIWLGN